MGRSAGTGCSKGRPDEGKGSPDVSPHAPQGVRSRITAGQSEEPDLHGSGGGFPACAAGEFVRRPVRREGGRAAVRLRRGGEGGGGGDRAAAADGLPNSPNRRGGCGGEAVTAGEPRLRPAERQGPRL